MKTFINYVLLVLAAQILGLWLATAQAETKAEIILPASVLSVTFNVC